MDSEFWIRAAVEQAKSAFGMGEVPVGAVVVHQNEIVGRGANRRERSHDPFGHAEILAMRAASKHLMRWRLNECVLVTTLEPCLMCLSACYQARISKVIYCARDAKGGALSLGYDINRDDRLNHRFEIEFFFVEECSQILTQFFRDKRLKENKF